MAAPFTPHAGAHRTGLLSPGLGSPGLVDADVELLDPDSAIDVESQFFEVAIGALEPAAFAETAGACVAAARTHAVSARRPAPVSAIIDAAFGVRPPTEEEEAAAVLHKETPSLEKRDVKPAPLTGLSTSSTDVDPVVAALRGERQLWRLAALVFDTCCPSLLALHRHAAVLAPFRAAALQLAQSAVSASDKASPFSVAAALPADTVANDLFATQAAAQFATDDVLLRTFLSWLATGAADDAHIRTPTGKVHSAATVSEYLSEPPPLPLDARGAGADIAPALAHARAMWRETAAGAVAAAAGGGVGAAAPAPGAGVVPTGFSLLDEAQGAAFALAATAAGFPASVHPDAASSWALASSTGSGTSGARLADADAQCEADLLASMWQLVRCGRPDLAQTLAARFGQPWRAAALLGTETWRDQHDDVLTPEEEAAAAAAAGGDVLTLAAASAAARHVMFGGRLTRRGNPFNALFRRAARAAADASGAPGSTPSSASALALLAPVSDAHRQNAAAAVDHDAALLLHAAGDVPQLVGLSSVVHTWEDAAWAVASAAETRRQDALVGSLRAAQAAATSRLPVPSSEPHDAASAAAGCGAGISDVAALECRGQLASLRPPAASAVTSSSHPPAGDLLSALAELPGICSSVERFDLKAACGSAYVGIVSALMRLAAAVAPTLESGMASTPAVEHLHAAGALAADDVLLPAPARKAISNAVFSLVKTLHETVINGDEEYGAAANANRAAMQAPVEPQRPAADGVMALSPLSPDALARARPLDPALVPLVRFSTHFLLYLRHRSLLRHDPVLMRTQLAAFVAGGAAAGAEASHTTLDGDAAAAVAAIGTTFGAPAVAELETQRSAVCDMCDDVLFVYARHLMALSEPRPGALPHRLLHVNGVLTLMLQLQAPRAVRALTTFLLRLPHGCEASMMVGSPVGGGEAFAATGVVDPTPRVLSVRELFFACVNFVTGGGEASSDGALPPYDLAAPVTVVGTELAAGGASGTAPPHALIPLVDAAVRNAASIMMACDAKTLHQLAASASAAAPTSAHELLDRAGIAPPVAPPPAPAWEQAGLTLVDWCRVTSLGLFAAAGTRYAVDIVTAANILCRTSLSAALAAIASGAASFPALFTAAHMCQAVTQGLPSFASTSAVGASAAAAASALAPAGAAGGSVLAPGSAAAAAASTSAITVAGAAGAAAAMLVPPLLHPEAIGAAAAAEMAAVAALAAVNDKPAPASLPLSSSSIEFSWWRSVLRAFHDYEQWAAAVSKPLPPAPTPPAAHPAAAAAAGVGSSGGGATLAGTGRLAASGGFGMGGMGAGGGWATRAGGSYRGLGAMATGALTAGTASSVASGGPSSVFATQADSVVHAHATRMHENLVRRRCEEAFALAAAASTSLLAALSEPWVAGAAVAIRAGAHAAGGVVASEGALATVLHPGDAHVAGAAVYAGAPTDLCALNDVVPALASQLVDVYLLTATWVARDAYGRKQSRAQLSGVAETLSRLQEAYRSGEAEGSEFEGVLPAIFMFAAGNGKGGKHGGADGGVESGASGGVHPFGAGLADAVQLALAYVPVGGGEGGGGDE